MRRLDRVRVCLADQTQRAWCNSEALHSFIHSFLRGRKNKEKDSFVFSWANDPPKRLPLDAKEELKESDSSSLYELPQDCVLWIIFIF